MDVQSLEKLKYPIGKFQEKAAYSNDIIQHCIDHIESLPHKLTAAVSGLTAEQLDTPYRTGGWTIRQVIHHIADSHINSYVRFKLALTEVNPSIKAYEETLWAEEKEAKNAPIDISLDLIAALHKRWVLMLKNMTVKDLEKTFFHPEHNRSFRLDATIDNYAWHSQHHLAHITSLKERMNW